MSSEQSTESRQLIEIISQLEIEKHAQGDAFKAYTELASEQVQANVSVAAGLYSLVTMVGVGIVWLALGAPALPPVVLAFAFTWILFNITRVAAGSRRETRSRRSYQERVSWLL